MDPIDFSRSFVTFFLPSYPNNARIQLNAACTVIDEGSGQSETFYLSVPVRHEDEYYRSDVVLFGFPNFDWCSIWSEREYRLVRNALTSEEDRLTYGVITDRFAVIRLDLRPLAGGRPLGNGDEVVQAVKEGLPLVARTEISDDGGRWRAVLMYPAKTINFLENPSRFQVDTGPLIIPDFTSTAEHVIESLDQAFTNFNALDKADFLLRRPTPVVQDGKQVCSITDYQVAVTRPVRTQLFVGS